MVSTWLKTAPSIGGEVVNDHVGAFEAFERVEEKVSRVKGELKEIADRRSRRLGMYRDVRPIRVLKLYDTRC
jgi:hypothetical protein